VLVDPAAVVAAYKQKLSTGKSVPENVQCIRA
jgi:hypothetical protein